jgi:hypothetical protein
MNRLSVTLAMALAFLPARAEAQRAEHPGYPNVNQPVEIAPGETIQVLSRVLVDRAPGMRQVRRLDYQVRSSIAPGDAAGREAQAARIVQAFTDAAGQAGVRMMSIAFCDTDACAKHTEPPRTWFVFERGTRGVWQRVKN